MGLRESPYSNRLLGALNSGARVALFPSYWLLNQLLALQSTTAEKRQRHKRCAPYALWTLAQGLLLLPAFVLSLPFSLVAFLFWLPLQAARRPYAYQHTPGRGPSCGEEWPLLETGQGHTFSFISGNVCLLPEGLAKFSNLSRSQWRAKHIGQILARAASGHHRRCSPPCSRNGSGVPNGYGATGNSPPRPCQRPLSTTVEVEFEGECDGAGEGHLSEVTARFPAQADFVCLQEVFDLRASASLCRLLGPCYPHILYDVGSYGLAGRAGLKVFNSGLFLASRHPILAVQYHCYPNGKGEDAFAAKGLLCAQVQLGSFRGQRIVGYLNCTHMHAPEADAQVRCDQMTLGLMWAQQFQDASTQPGDIVAFDIYCGDLNFDNCSEGDELEQSHDIFTVYTDPCRVGPREDKPWVIGTLMAYLEIYEEPVSTPENMKRTLEQPDGRKKFLAGPVLADGQPDPSATGCEGRRLDYILYREHPGSLGLRTAVEKVSFITQLATCSDHLPFGLRLHVTPTMHAEEA
nr:sphingomyelin phosphodiesterase 5-like [Anolis sagrei ordinatus]XP_060632022.1 sphingomyelin phosphodiesterase 5-like [Anolis sagrei ordinatus]XP_060632023.1 sphingomyelin phosphodiesterase 5-like [Anolis sagrei ordinatus]